MQQTSENRHEVIASIRDGDYVRATFIDDTAEVFTAFGTAYYHEHDRRWFIGGYRLSDNGFGDCIDIQILLTATDKPIVMRADVCSIGKDSKCQF